MIALLTDFGARDAYAGILEGVIESIAPGTRVADLSHEISPGNVRHAAFLLREAAPYFPQGTIFVAVVDPGVGSARRPLALQTSRFSFVGPDNGLFTFALWSDPIQAAVELANPAYRLPEVSATFHGRDIFAPAAAHLARGVLLSDLGPAVTDLVPLPSPKLTLEAGRVVGEVMHADRFGNLITSIGRVTHGGDGWMRLDPWIPGRGEAVNFAAGAARMFLGKKGPLEMSRMYAAQPEGQAIALIGSHGHLEIAVNRGSAKDFLNAREGDEVRLEIEGIER